MIDMRATARERFRKDGNGQRVSQGWFVFVHDEGKQRGRKASSEAAARAIVKQINQDAQAADNWMLPGALPCDEALRGWIATHAAEMKASTEARSPKV